jgi:hypothetical protein
MEHPGLLGSASAAAAGGAGGALSPMGLLLSPRSAVYAAADSGGATAAAGDGTGGRDASENGGFGCRGSHGGGGGVLHQLELGGAGQPLPSRTMGAAAMPGGLGMLPSGGLLGSGIGMATAGATATAAGCAVGDADLLESWWAADLPLVPGSAAAASGLMGAAAGGLAPSYGPAGAGLGAVPVGLPSYASAMASTSQVPSGNHSSVHDAATMMALPPLHQHSQDQLCHHQLVLHQQPLQQHYGPGLSADSSAEHLRLQASVVPGVPSVGHFYRDDCHTMMMASGHHW